MSKKFKIQIVSSLIAIHGLFLLIISIDKDFTYKKYLIQSSLFVNFSVLLGISLVFLSIQLLRAKKNAWTIAITLYLFTFAIFIYDQFFKTTPGFSKVTLLKIINLLFLSVLIFLLIKWRTLYKVKSDIASLRFGMIILAVVMLIMIGYGVTGFMLMDKTDFHRELSFGTSLHYTIDQFNITTSPLKPYTKKARLFIDSLSTVSFLAIIYGLFAVFQPIKFKYEDQTGPRQAFEELLKRSKADSEDYFKIWPHDKKYYFYDDFQAGLAYKVSRGIAICLGDPIGESAKFKKLITNFQDDCYINNWNVSFIHATDKNLKLFKSLGFNYQLIGQEAVVDIDTFVNTTLQNKYFRNINNKFTKQSYSSEILLPPHNKAILDRLQEISDQWLLVPGRTERGFAMGYFSKEYMNLCEVVVVRDAASTIQAFINLIPASFDKKEATYDLLRHSKNQIGNINDYLLINFINYLKTKGYESLNMGLSPLVGIDEAKTSDFSLITSLLKVVYANGNRFYSFQGLFRFKNKFEPKWRNRYVVYRGSSFSGFVKTMNSLVKAMRI